jgi:YspA, cpYpsA-related SLOG family
VETQKRPRATTTGRGVGLPRACRIGYHVYMRILVTGDRHWRCDDLAEQVLNRLLARYGPDLVVVHGGAPGVDQAFNVAARELGITVEPHVADWKGLGNIAGPARNQEMVESGADLSIALHRTLATSKGTRDCVRRGPRHQPKYVAPPRVVEKCQLLSNENVCRMASEQQTRRSRSHVELISIQDSRRST